MTAPDAPLDPAALRAHYRAFLRDDRVLLTGHSHQAWPDVARAAMLRAFDDAALHVDDKWAAAFEAAEAVRRAIAANVGATPDRVALGESTHTLVVRFLSALPWSSRRHLVTTRGEFHTLHRQLRRLAEEGVRVDFVDPYPVDTLAARLAEAVRDDTAALLCSTVLFETATVVPSLDHAVAAARAKGAQVLLDGYHHYGVRPLSLPAYGDAFLTGGGYKYAQWGEGVCFLVAPADCALRPVVTGWFADFASLSERRLDAPVRYGDAPRDRFAGATYDPVSHYRARAVVDFFAAQAMTPARLADSYTRQTARILDAVCAAGFTPATPLDPQRRGGFVSVPVANVAEVVEGLRADGVWVDARGDLVRLGPAPYLTDAELDRAVAAFLRRARRA